MALYCGAMKSMKKFYVEWRKAVRRLLNLPYDTHSDYLHLIVSDNPVNIQIFKRFNKFMHKVSTSDNYFINIAGILAFNGSDSNVCKKINCISQMLNCDRIRVLSSLSQFARFVKEYLIKDEKEHIKVITGNIMDLLTLRDAKTPDAVRKK